MKKEVLSQFGQPELVLLAFLLFFVCFLGVIVSVFLQSKRNHFDKIARIPLNDEPVEMKE